MFPPKITAPSPLGIVTPRNTLFLEPSSLIMPNGISIGSAVFVWVPNAMLYNALTVGNKPPKLSLPYGNHPAGGGPSHGHRQDTQKNSKHRACGSGDILADRQTHTYTDVLITILCNRSRWQSKNKWAILRSRFDYLTFWCFLIFRPLLLTCYITIPLMQKHIGR